jgi:hypothetical protein
LEIKRNIKQQKNKESLNNLRITSKFKLERALIIETASAIAPMDGNTRKTGKTL